ncbi:ZINC FINGER BED DOMAIN-CONTAINING PROTEIN DAYSLEEPER-LIKE ISOFORM X1 [Salix koriyanagi]|uniref:ZINC FINGER BED DOMAIN-CONTAINING PROTEIN DAYSLEEPER-LIKE ISOFORM X1 n=1 Tax=Salix koriyanagi TaxID=2511006 RepID=A0A9Q0PYH4_9ROSI|nr:ZINC FINGER BED DOMAIN-CONTAINING PROTEIN DAYSLEEPER-LIKE ISOFORM X1 [Salix koriyanagi]
MRYTLKRRPRNHPLMKCILKKQTPHESHTEQVPSQEMQIEEVPSQEVRSQEMNNEEKHPQDIRTKELSQEVSAQEIHSEEVPSQEVSIQEMQTEDVRPQEMQTEEVRPQEMQTEDVQPQEMQLQVICQGMQSQELHTQDIPMLSIGDGLSDFDIYISEITGGQHFKSELDQYLEESLLPRVHEFDVLGWWKLNRLKYPTLSKMAVDILSIPMSTVAPDSVFDTENRRIDSYRSSLRPVTLEALICAKDWLQHL